MIVIADRYRLPTCWADVVWGDYEAIAKGTLAYLDHLAIPEWILQTNLELVKQALSFLEEEIIAQETFVPDAYDLTLDTYISLLLCTNPIEFLATYDLRDTEYSEAELRAKIREIEQEPICKRIALVQNLRKAIEQTEQELAKHYEQYRVPMTDAQKRSGVSALSERWGYYVIIDTLAGGDFLKKKEVLQKKMIDVVTEIKYLNEKNYYQYKIQKEIEYEQRRSYKKHT